MKIAKIVLTVLFTALYFICFAYGIHWLFRNTLSAMTNIFSIFCLIVAFLVSFGLAEFTARKIADRYMGR